MNKTWILSLTLAVSFAGAACADLWIDQDFESINPVSGTDWYGNASSTSGRWGPFDPDNHAELATNEIAYSGTHSVRIERGVTSQSDPVLGRTEIGYVGSGSGSAPQFQLQFQVYRDDNGSAEGSSIVHWRLGTSAVPSPGDIFISSVGSIGIWDGNGYSYVASSLVTADTWFNIRADYDLDQGTYGQAVIYTTQDGNSEVVQGTVTFQTNFLAQADRITFNPQGSDNTITYFDDFDLTAVPEPGVASLFGTVAFVALALRRRSR